MPEKARPLGTSYNFKIQSTLKYDRLGRAASLGTENKRSCFIYRGENRKRVLLVLTRVLKYSWCLRALPCQRRASRARSVTALVQTLRAALPARREKRGRELQRAGAAGTRRKAPGRGGTASLADAETTISSQRAPLEAPQPPPDLPHPSSLPCRSYAPLNHHFREVRAWLAETWLGRATRQQPRSPASALCHASARHMPPWRPWKRSCDTSLFCLSRQPPRDGSGDGCVIYFITKTKATATADS